MTRLVFVIALMPLTACFQSHPSGQQELSGGDCYTCHTHDYNATTAPVHHDMPQVFSTTCTNCHRTVGWQPALAGQHNEAFIIAKGAHAGIACLDCHDLASGLPSTQGANTNCIQCHPNDRSQADNHDGVKTSSGSYQYLANVPNFCLQCHPAGTGDTNLVNVLARKAGHAVPSADNRQ